MVHKKKHDMVLNLGLGSKGNTFSDQTPTPTRFIRNCEEVGLFQDLQNVNPFEETFRKAVEAVKTGQTPLLDKSFQTNPSDDTLHTPNIFPHITDLPCVNSKKLDPNGNGELQVNVQKKDSKNNNNDEKAAFTKTDIEPNKIILGNINHKKRKSNTSYKPEIVEIQSDEQQRQDPETLEKTETCIVNVAVTDNVTQLNQVQAALKEKIKSNIQLKEMPVVLQLKVPIPKSNSTSTCQKSFKDRFSTFSRNSLKFESKLVKPQSGIFDLNKRRVIKNYNGLPKDRIEILERNRAAATRCREKKKIYVSYLERVNRELTEANKKLKHSNANLEKQVTLLKAELLKHQNCNMSSINGGKIASLINSNMTREKKTGDIENTQVGENVQRNENCDSSQNCGEIESVTTVFDMVEVSLIDECSNSQNDKTIYCNIDEPFVDSHSKPYVMKSFYEEEKLRKIYTDHSYSNYQNTIDVRKRNVIGSKPKLNSAFLVKDNGNVNVISDNGKGSFEIEPTSNDPILGVQMQSH